MRSAEQIIASARTLGSLWQRVPVERQRELFGRVLFGRSEIRLGMHGIRVRNRNGRDANGMPRYQERLFTYRDLVAMCEQQAA